MMTRTIGMRTSTILSTSLLTEDSQVLKSRGGVEYYSSLLGGDAQNFIYFFHFACFSRISLIKAKRRLTSIAKLLY
jgi:hypothetical protein